LKGSFKNQQRAAERLAVVLPITLLIIFLLIYFQFRSVHHHHAHCFSALSLVWAGGFIMLWLYGESLVLELQPTSGWSSGTFSRWR
jgi:copper/silver efflux system protein